MDDPTSSGSTQRLILVALFIQPVWFTVFPFSSIVIFSLVNEFPSQRSTCPVVSSKGIHITRIPFLL